MGLPAPPAVLVLVAFVRRRLGDVVAPLLPRAERGCQTELVPRQVITGAASPFALTTFARARLLRQLYASGLLDEQARGRGPQQDQQCATPVSERSAAANDPAARTVDR